MHTRLLARCFSSMSELDRDSFVRYDALLPIHVAQDATDNDAELLRHHFEEVEEVDVRTHVRARQQAPPSPLITTESNDSISVPVAPIPVGPRALLLHTLAREYATLMGHVIQPWTFHRGMNGLLLPFGRPEWNHGRVRLPEEVQRWGLAFVEMGDDPACYLGSRDRNTGCLEEFLPVLDPHTVFPQNSWHSLFVSTPPSSVERFLRLSSALPTEELHHAVCVVLVRLNPCIALEEAVCLAVAVLMLLCGDNRTMGDAALLGVDGMRRERLAVLWDHPVVIPSREELFVTLRIHPLDRTDMVIVRAPGGDLDKKINNRARRRSGAAEGSLGDASPYRTGRSTPSQAPSVSTAENWFRAATNATEAAPTVCRRIRGGRRGFATAKGARSAPTRGAAYGPVSRGACVIAPHEPHPSVVAHDGTV